MFRKSASESAHESHQADQEKTVRERIDEVVSGDARSICDHIQLETRKLMLGKQKRRQRVFDRTDKIIHGFRETNDQKRAAGMYRYLMEGGEKSYSVDVTPFMDMLRHEDLLDGPKRALFDLGAGPGGAVREWKRTGRPGRGMDLSPSFVLQNPDLRLGLIDSDYGELLEALDGGYKPGLVTTSMTLDRVRKPAQLLSNVTNLSRQFHAPFVVSTILPVNPVDDDMTAKVKIVYTDPEDLLVDGDDAAEHEEEILRRLQELAQDYRVRVKKIPYTISSSDVTHEYTQHCFVGRPK